MELTRSEKRIMVTQAIVERRAIYIETRIACGMETPTSWITPTLFTTASEERIDILDIVKLEWTACDLSDE